MKWVDRAANMVEIVRGMGAPQEITNMASDAVQHFVWASDCRKQSRILTHGGMPGWGAKADKAHYHGKKCFHAAQKWYLDAKSAKQKINEREDHV